MTVWFCFETAHMERGDLTLQTDLPKFKENRSAL